MNASIQALTLAMQELGWREEDGDNPRMRLWVPGEQSGLRYGAEDREEIAVFVPRDPEAPGADRLTKRAIADLSRVSVANVDERIADAVLRLELHLDKFTIHLETTEERAGVVDFEEGIDLFAGMRKILMTGARTAQETRGWHRNGSFTVAQNYIDSCMLAQTEVGSYVATALTPATKPIKRSNSASKKAVNEAPGRHITQVTVDALQSTREALDNFLKTGADEEFHYGVPSGVSSELLGGVGDVVGDGESEVTVEYIALPGQDETPPSKHVVFEPRHREAAYYGREILKHAPKLSHAAIAGEVVELHRRFEDPNSRRIRLRATVEGKTRSFVARLSQEDYDKAQQAHYSGLLLAIRGLEKQGKFEEIENVHVTETPVNKVRLEAEPEPELF